MAKQNILDFFNESGLRVRLEILEILVSDIIEVEIKNPDIQIKEKLGDIGHFFYKDVLVMLDNGIGVMREDGSASRLNVHALSKFAIDNFGWKGKTDTTNANAIQTKAAPAGCIFELFRWNEAIFRIRNGPDWQNKIIISDFVQNEITKALNRKNAVPITRRILKRRTISGFQPIVETKKIQIQIQKEPKIKKIKELKIKELKIKQPKKIKEPKIKFKKQKKQQESSFFNDENQSKIFDDELTNALDDDLPFPSSLQFVH